MGVDFFPQGIPHDRFLVFYLYLLNEIRTFNQSNRNRNRYMKSQPISVPVSIGYSSTRWGRIRWESRNGTLTKVRIEAGVFDKAESVIVHEADKSVLKRAETGLQLWLERKPVVYDLPLDPDAGTDFQWRVWKRVAQIPLGQTLSYGQLAAELGDPALTRAVGRANACNPFWLVIPCHRVVGKNGSLTGYAGGLKIKELLLRHEGAIGDDLFG
jgi:methylated-DNA-[protein]-cysteine S-methyltransferase